MMRSRRKGAALILVLAVLSGTAAILAGAFATQRIAFKAELNRLEQRRARLMAEAGLQRALAALTAQEPNRVAQDGEWYTLGNRGGDEFQVGDGSFRLEIIDASSLVNLNSATEEQLLNMNLTQEQADSLLDWVTEERNPRPQGAKDEFYNSLTTPYNAKLRRFDSVDELLLVRGFTPDIVYGQPPDARAAGSDQRSTFYQFVTAESWSPNVNEQGQQKLNINTATLQNLISRGLGLPLATAIIAQRNTLGTFTTMGDVLRSPGVTIDVAATLLDNFSVSNEPRVEGRINLNTASEEILNTIPDMPSDVASAIVSRQGAGFTTLGEITTIPGVDLPFLQANADRFTISSQTWIARVIGIAGSSRVPLEAIIALENGVPKIVKVTQPPFTDMTPLWIWDPEPSGQVDLGAAR
jgi:type II secretory pathway component PulK